jgi:hypothetical protein
MGKLHGRVIDRKTGKKIPNAIISMKVTYHCGGPSSPSSQDSYSVKTSLAGEYTVSKPGIINKIFSQYPQAVYECSVGTISNLEAEAPGYNKEGYQPDWASGFQFNGNTYRRDFYLTPIK